MRNFNQLLTTLESPADSSVKDAALKEYILKTHEAELIFGVALLSRKQIPSLFSLQAFKKAVIKDVNIPDWLFEMSYKSVGNLTETLALLVHAEQNDEVVSLSELLVFLNGGSDLSLEEKTERALSMIKPLDFRARKVCVQLFCGNFQFHWNLKDLADNLASRYKVDPFDVYQNLNSDWSPWDTTLDELCSKSSNKAIPLPMQMALKNQTSDLDQEKKRWKVEYLWKGIRVHVMINNGDVFFWTKDQEQIGAYFPEFHKILSEVADSCVLDAVLVPLKEMEGLSLKKRVGRKTVNSTFIKKHPVKMVVFDILKHGGKDLRNHTLVERKAILKNWMDSVLNPGIIEYSSFLENKTIRLANENPPELWRSHIKGLIRKLPSSSYNPNNAENWEEHLFKPEKLLCALLYAERGGDGHQSLLTLSISNEGSWIPLVKLPSNLDEAQQLKLDEWVLSNTTERFGPVRQVVLKLVFEIQYNEIALAPARKSGIELPDARITGWKKDLSVADVLKAGFPILP